MQNTPTKKQKLVVILGSTASGKSDLAVAFAKKFGGLSAYGRAQAGEVVSADSRQVYRGLDIGTGKITKREMKGVPHHLLDVADPKRRFSVARYKKLAEKAVAGIARRGKLPILCGGTGFYIQAIVDGVMLPEAAPDKRLRARLEKMSSAELFAMLQKRDPRRAREIDAKNPRRLIRAIEIARALGAVPHLEPRVPSKYEVLQIGIKTDSGVLKEKIHKRLVARIRAGMVAEARHLHERGLSWRRMEELGLEYRYLARYLQGKLTKKEMIDQLSTAIWQYAKRQKTWFKRDKRVKWFALNDKKKIEREVTRFLRR